MEALECVAKVLEETKDPDLAGAIKKSVKFSPQVAKEIAITKMALVQPKSNMAGPMEVEDEFDDEEVAVNDKPKSPLVKTILKRNRSPPPPPSSANDDEEEEDQEAPSTSTPQVTTSSSTEVSF